MKNKRKEIKINPKDMRCMIIGFLAFCICIAFWLSGEVEGDTVIGALVVTVITLLLFAEPIYSMLRKKSVQKKIKGEGNYVVAEVTGIDIMMDYWYKIKKPYRIRCKYVDEEGISQDFYSNVISFNSKSVYVNSRVRVYINRNDNKKYYVDLDSDFPDKSQYVIEGNSLNEDKRIMYAGMTAIGTSIVLLLVGIYEFIDSYGDYEVLIAMSVMAIPVLILGILMIKKAMNNRKACETLRQNGNYVTAEIVSASCDNIYASVVYHLYHVQCIYMSDDGAVHFYKTEILVKKLPKNLVGRKIKVYCSEDMSDYFIDKTQLQ